MHIGKSETLSKVIDVEELKSLQLDMLREIKHICEKNSLRYYLCGGTLLGAIRHKGYIPWDDDIDIIMPRSDYMKFHKLFNTEAKPYYRFRSVFNERDWDSTFAKVEDTRTVKKYNSFNEKVLVGVCIDVFPTDGAPSSILARRLFWFVQNLLARIAYLSTQKFTISQHYVDLEEKHTGLKTVLRTFIKFMMIPLAKLTRPFQLFKFVNLLAMRYDVDKTKYIGVSTFPHYGYRECIKGRPFLKMRNRSFEGELFGTPDNYEEYLSNLYGDYMKIPPIEKQVSHHDFIAYWKNDNMHY